ncbi:poly (3-hydroxybutyrate) depolymerase [Methylobacterium sp. 4-46]|uniref:extracellular catalytic domain type 2 short-chain-length polyhydroxyalkanoate depolymerase n=1 Tax=unclassified Methylobacterium TaxID=2615210 RepID=UPI000152E2FA|nr:MULTISPECIES: poly(3-hydroxybutyrate) depolymerase [Methylobacterium]ACA15225.1 poly (3-hydroxybutyrate) depolymerase [Methylobacterium sp. 4-46]WFT80955.1 poly(3-hydroxybutyrate) depolymerase [Methylobacterium nodulans]
MGFEIRSTIEQLSSFQVRKGQSSVSGLSSGAFMTVQLHLAHSSRFAGAGIIAGGPFRCAESFRAAALIAEDAYEQGALYISMNPLIPQMAPSAEHLAEIARRTAEAGEIDPVENLADDRLYIFTGSADRVVYPDVVARTRRFYELLGVAPENILYRDTVPAGHSIITDNPEDSPLSTNQPPYINNGGFMQSHEILRHIYPGLNAPAERLNGRLIRFDQTEFFAGEPRSSMSPFGYAYVPAEVLEGAEARIHVALHGCKQGYAYINYVNGQPDVANQPPYGNRYVTTTGYNHIAESNNIIVLYPQAQGSDGGALQNPDGCWDWWGYTSRNTDKPDYYSKNAIQVGAIQAMLTRLGG